MYGSLLRSHERTEADEINDPFTRVSFTPAAPWQEATRPWKAPDSGNEFEWESPARATRTLSPWERHLERESLHAMQIDASLPTESPCTLLAFYIPSLPILPTSLRLPGDIGMWSRLVWGVCYRWTVLHGKKRVTG